MDHTLPHDAYLDVLEVESARFARAAAGAPADRTVPTCPDWRPADLLWHLAEVQYFWSRIAGGQDVEEVPDLARPRDEYLQALFEEQTLALLDALRRRAPSETCWSWSPVGETIGWVARRQAHEALIHRVDAELVAGIEVTGPDPRLATDGVDEMVRIFLDGLPDWARFRPDDRTALLVADDTDAAWTLAFGRFTGTSPNTGRTYDDATVVVRDAVTTPDVTITGPAWDLDRWLWGRGGPGALQVDGDADLATELRRIAEVD
jgi:uncharacterized protein (TIGR03083 family)